MGKAKIAITLNERALGQIDRLVRDGVVPNRSRAIEDAVVRRFTKLHRSHLAQECAKLDPTEEQALAEEGSLGESDSRKY